MTRAVVAAATVQVGSSTWSEREAELLTVTLQLLQEHGYAGLTVDAVAATARASKATVYRRWPSKAELVLAAVVESFRQVGDTPDTGTLRGDLIQIGEVIRVQILKQASTIAAIFFELSHGGELSRAFRHEFVGKQKLWIHEIVQRAVIVANLAPAPSPMISGMCCPAISCSAAPSRSRVAPLAPT